MPRPTISQVLYNVLAYSIYRSPESATIAITVESNPKTIAIVISDPGDPIENPSQIGIIGPDDNSGTGELGVSIARQGLKLLGGTLSAHNIGSGAELRVEFPLRALS